MVMNSPMPTEIAVLRGVGTARKTAVRNPVSTRTVMMIPSSTMSPIASAHVICGSFATPKATKALSPRPVARASGKLATSPMRMVITPATSAVAAATSARLGLPPPPRKAPVESAWVPMMSGLSTMM